MMTITCIGNPPWCEIHYLNGWLPTDRQLDSDFEGPFMVEWGPDE